LGFLFLELKFGDRDFLLCDDAKFTGSGMEICGGSISGVGSCIGFSRVWCGPREWVIGTSISLGSTYGLGSNFGLER
jgi:hypothetical protein